MYILIPTHLKNIYIESQTHIVHTIVEIYADLIA